MNRKPINSSRISSVGWENFTLEVQLKDGRIFRYCGVVEAEYKSLIYSATPDKNFSIIEKSHTRIRIL